MREVDLAKANANLAERKRLAEEIVFLMPKHFKRYVLFRDVREWRVLGKRDIKGHEHETVAFSLTDEDIDALIAIRERKVEELAEEFEKTGVA